MCNLYSHTKGPKAIRDLAKKMGGGWLDSTGNLEPQPSIFPDQFAPVVRSTPDGIRELVRMRWGFLSPPRAKSKITTNVRNAKSGWWKPWLQEGHQPIDLTLDRLMTAMPLPLAWDAQRAALRFSAP
jgi:putative SOS response-associated peptidase YedK